MEKGAFTPSTLTTLPLLDATLCDNFKALMATEFTNLCQGFQQDIIEAVSQIAAASEAEIDQIAELSHKYKSAAGYIGALRLHRALEQLEIFARQQDFSSCQSLSNKTLEIAQQSTQALQDYLHKTP